MLDTVEAKASNTVIRVAGGWVRDKLLGRKSDDIDIALDNLTGEAFAEMVNSYLLSQGIDAKKVAVVKANPLKSKHLQTARLKVIGAEVDLVNLRTETYSMDSRIPEAKFGTAEEDALRRDFTVNALFYNVNTGKVEDLTGRGIDDLRTGVIQTPLSPKVTFLDDPLRVLRGVRFSARFDFSLHEDLVAAAKDKDIQTALGSKVSRERIGVELCGMLSGKMARPAKALSLLCDLGLMEVIFAPPPACSPPRPETGYNWTAGIAAAHATAALLCAQDNNAAIIQKKNVLHEELFFSCALLPLAVVKYADKKGNMQPVPSFVMKESLKLKVQEGENVTKILQLLPVFQRLADSPGTREESEVKSRSGLSRLDCGLAVRDAKGLQLWQTCIYLNCAIELSRGSSDSSNCVELEVGALDQENQVVAKHEGLREAIFNMGLGEAWAIKPLLAGTSIINDLKVPKGPGVRTVLDEQVLWQLEHPDGTAEECKEHLANKLASGGIQMPPAR
ncbi:unnamed protein product [Choristocarpus tenellus]